MVYTNNVPQANQTISATQSIIQSNFGFMQDWGQTEHNFNATGSGSDGYHLRASMPNQADPSSLPAGTNGQYYISGNNPKFYNGTASFMSLGLQGTMVISNGAIPVSGNSSVNIPGPSGNVGGFIETFRSDGKYSIDVFFNNTPSTLQNIVTLLSNSTNFPFTKWNGTNLAIQNTSSSNFTFHFIVYWYPTV